MAYTDYAVVIRLKRDKPFSRACIMSVLQVAYNKAHQFGGCNAWNKFKDKSQAEEFADDRSNNTQ